MKKKIFVVIVTLLMCLSAIVIIPNDSKVEATSGGGDNREDNSIGLDLEFVWNVTNDLANVVHNYPDGMIPKGRAFGTWGDIWTANYLKDVMSIDLELENVQKLQIGHIPNSKRENYSTKVEVNDYSLSIYHSDPLCQYPYQNPVPWSEVFPVASAYPNKLIGGSVTHNYTFDNVSVYRIIDHSENRNENWPFGGTYNDYFYNISAQVLNTYNVIVGNATYIAGNDSLPEVQDGMVFLIEEEEGCDSQIANISSNASGCILLHNNARGYSFSSATSYLFPILRVNENEENITDIIDMLENGELMLVDNVLDNGTLTFTYNLSECNSLPLVPFVFIMEKIPDPRQTHNQWAHWGDTSLIAIALWWFNVNQLCQCKGLIIYDSFDTHFMPPTQTNVWTMGGIGYGPALPMFSVNYSVGNWIWNNTHLFSRPKINGFIDQEYFRETETSPGVEAYNVVGYRNISHSPDDNITIISNRYDGYWGETPGDSGLFTEKDCLDALSLLSHLFHRLDESLLTSTP